MNAPIALFVYARPDHLRRTVEALLKNPEAVNSDLIVFSDAARTPDNEESVHRVREYVAGIEGFRSLTVHHRTQNFGLAKSIIEGVTQVLADHERVIVLEDDLETSPHFLRFMNEALDRYEHDSRVISVHGYVYPTEQILPETFFLRGADCWGWATWRSGWMHFNPDGQYLFDELKNQNLLRTFDLNGAYSYSRMLQDQINGRNDSWAVRWHASAFLANKLTLYPGRSLVWNFGSDGSGTHCDTTNVFDVQLSNTPICLGDIAIEESAGAEKAIEYFHRTKQSLIQRLHRRFMPDKILQTLIALTKDLLPPLFLRQFRRFRGITFAGPFASWEEAKQRSSGYNDEAILHKVLAATLKVKHGEVAFERDSVLFDEIQYAWPITAGLLWAAAREGGRLSVLDFGGSLGSSYFQNRRFLEGLQSVRWSVVEQAHFVEAGREHIQHESLMFYTTIAECAAVEKPNVVLLSSVLQYLEAPYSVLDELVRSGAEIILIDRTCFLDRDGPDVYKVQITPASIYSSSYPVRYFDRRKFLNWFVMNGFREVEQFQSLDKLDSAATWQGFVLERTQI